VPENHGRGENEASDAPFGPVVHITAANAGVVYGEEDIVRGLQGGFGFLFEGDGEGFVENEGKVLEIGN
jgi:hypothetical protein